MEIRQPGDERDESLAYGGENGTEMAERLGKPVAT